MNEAGKASGRGAASLKEAVLLFESRLPTHFPLLPSYVCNQSNSRPLHQQFNAASTEYYRVTKNRLDTYPLAAQLDSCHCPEDISNVLRSQAHAFSKFHEDDEKLMKWLTPTINILCTLSDTLGEAITLVSWLILSSWLFTDIGASAIFTREDDLYRYCCPTWRESPHVPCIVSCDMELSLAGRERCCIEP